MTFRCSRPSLGRGRASTEFSKDVLVPAEPVVTYSHRPIVRLHTAAPPKTRTDLPQRARCGVVRSAGSGAACPTTGSCVPPSGLLTHQGILRLIRSRYEQRSAVEGSTARQRPSLEECCANSGVTGRTVIAVVADRDPQVRDAWRRIVCQLEGGAHVLEANDYARLLKRLADAVQMLVVDLNMPGIEGIGRLHRLRIKYPRLSIVVASGGHDAPTIRAGLAAGINGSISKRIADLLLPPLRPGSQAGSTSPKRAC